MSVLFTILTVLIVLASILTIIVVLLQNGKGGGIASNFVSANQAFGVRQTADFLEKLTWGLITFILVASIISSLVYTSNTKGAAKQDVDAAEEETTTADASADDQDSTADLEDAAAAEPAAEEPAAPEAPEAQ